QRDTTNAAYAQLAYTSGNTRHDNRCTNETDASRGKDNGHISCRTMQYLLHKRAGKFTDQQHNVAHHGKLNDRKVQHAIIAYKMPALHNIVPQSFDGLTRFLPCVPAMLAEMLLLKLTRRDAENEASTYKIEECHHDKQQINRLYMQREKDQVQRKGRK